MSDRNSWTEDEGVDDPFAPEMVEDTIAKSLRQDTPATATAVLIRRLADAYTLPPAAEAMLARSRATLARRAEALKSGTLPDADEQEISSDSVLEISRLSTWSPHPRHRPLTAIATAWRTLAAVLVVALLGTGFFALLHGIPRPTAHPTATSTPAPAHRLTWQPVTTTAPDGSTIFAAGGESAYTCDVGKGILSIRHTSDRGVTWIPARIVPTTPNITRCELVVDVSHPSVAALAWQPLGNGSYTGGMTTVDGGVTWQATPGTPSTQIDQLDSRGGVIYALRETGDGSHLWASADRMDTWHQVDHGLPAYLTGFWLEPDGAGILVVESNTGSNPPPEVPSALWTSPNGGATWQKLEVPGVMDLHFTARDAAVGPSGNGLVARSLQGRFHICTFNGATLVSPQLVQTKAVVCSTDGGTTWQYYSMPQITSAQGALEGMSLLGIANDGSLLATVAGTLYRLDLTAGGRLQSLGPIPEPGVVYMPASGSGILWAAPSAWYSGDPQHRIFTASYTP